MSIAQILGVLIAVLAVIAGADAFHRASTGLFSTDTVVIVEALFAVTIGLLGVALASAGRRQG
jgi:hypothetical protein